MQRIAFVAVGALTGALVFWLVRAEPIERTPGTHAPASAPSAAEMLAGATRGEATPDAAQPPRTPQVGDTIFDPKTLRVGLGRAQEPNDRPLCDTHSAGLAAEIVAFRDGDRVFVDGDAWLHKPIGGQGGIASWLSKCQHDSRPVAIHGAADGRLLARYDGRDGYRLAN